MKNYSCNCSTYPLLTYVYPSLSGASQRWHQTHMADLKTSPADVKQPWKDGVVEILMGYGLTSERPKDRQESEKDNDKSKQVPWCSLAYINKNFTIFALALI